MQATKAASTPLNRARYLALEKPSERHPVERYASVESDLYDAILNRCVEAGKMCMKDIMAIDAGGGLSMPGASNVAIGAMPGAGNRANRTFVAAMCSVNDPIDPLLAAPVVRTN